MKANESLLCENDFVRFYMEEGVLHSEFKKEVNADKDVTIQMIALRHELSNNEDQIWCANFSKLKGFDKEGRDYAEKHGQQFLISTAVLVDSSVIKYIANLWNKLKKPHVPMKVFTEKTEAVNWLNSQKIKLKK